MTDETLERAEFHLNQPFEPGGDQPTAIEALTKGFESGSAAQVLLGATGTGKTFTMANVIANLGRPALILSHNKTLAAQLYGEFKGFFPHNAVEYFVSYLCRTPRLMIGLQHACCPKTTVVAGRYRCPL